MPTPIAKTHLDALTLQRPKRFFNRLVEDDEITDSPMRRLKLVGVGVEAHEEDDPADRVLRR